MCSCDYEYADFYEIRTHKARKTHKCLECRQSINKGDIYTYHRAFNDGSWFWGRLCSNCMNVYEYIQKHEECFCPSLGGLIYEIKEWGLEAEDYLIPFRILDSGEVVQMDTNIDEEDERWDEDLHEATSASFFRLNPKYKDQQLAA